MVLSKVVYDSSRVLFSLAFRLLSGMAIVSAQNVPREGAVLICPNHISDCDPPAVYVACRRNDITFVAKEELFRIPVVSGILRAIGAIGIRRDSADRDAIRRIEAALKRGRAVVMFPEGRLSETGRLGEVQPGAAMIALRVGAPIVPVGLTRTNSVLPYGRLLPSRSRLAVRVEFAKALPAPANVKGRASIDALTNRLEQELRRLTAQEGQKGGP